VAHFPENFAPGILELQGNLLNPDTLDIEQRPLRDWVFGPLQQTHMLWLKGVSGAGKSTLARAIARELCDQCEECPKYVYTKDLDVMGLLTREQMLDNVSCFVFVDCPLVSDRKLLSALHVMALQDPLEEGVYPARYAQAKLGRQRPRIGTVNQNYFVDEGRADLEALSAGDERFFRDGNGLSRADGPVAVARRAFIVTVNAAAQISAPVNLLEEKTAELMSDRLARAAARRAAEGRPALPV
jgi:hypothetical protein